MQGLARTLADPARGALRLAALAAALLAAVAAPVRAQTPRRDVQAELVQIEAETHCYNAPGPAEGEHRAICVWRPPGSETQTLPTLYAADGLIGLKILVADYRAALLAGAQIQPFLIVATDPRANPEERAGEYIRGWNGGAGGYRAHEQWVLSFVIPWAERTLRAAPDRARRAVGGFSNGGDYALSMALDHPDVFSGALIHSPVGAAPNWASGTGAGQRWVITGGREETHGSVRATRPLGEEVGRALRSRGDAVRVCVGGWGHEGRAWRQLSAGSLVWLLGLGDVGAAQSDLERRSCQNTEAAAAPGD